MTPTSAAAPPAHCKYREDHSCRNSQQCPQYPHTLNNEETSHRSSPEQGENDQVHRSDHGVELTGDYRGRNIQLEQVVGKPEEVNQERQGNLGLGKVAWYPGGNQPRIVTAGQWGTAQPGRKRDEQQGQQLAGIREIEHDRNQDFRCRFRVVVEQAMARQGQFAALYQDWQHDKSAAGSESSQQGVARDADYL